MFAVDLNFPIADELPADQCAADERENPITGVGPIAVPSFVEDEEGPKGQKRGEDQKPADGQPPDSGGLQPGDDDIDKNEIDPPGRLFEEFDQAFDTSPTVRFKGKENCVYSNG